MCNCCRDKEQVVVDDSLDNIKENLVSYKHNHNQHDFYPEDRDNYSYYHSFTPIITTIKKNKEEY